MPPNLVEASAQVVREYFEDTGSAVTDIPVNPPKCTPDFWVQKGDTKILVEAKGKDTSEEETARIDQILLSGEVNTSSRSSEAALGARRKLQEPIIQFDDFDPKHNHVHCAWFPCFGKNCELHHKQLLSTITGEGSVCDFSKTMSPEEVRKHPIWGQSFLAGCVSFCSPETTYSCMGLNMPEFSVGIRRDNVDISNNIDIYVVSSGKSLTIVINPLSPFPASSVKRCIATLFPTKEIYECNLEIPQCMWGCNEDEKMAYLKETYGLSRKTVRMEMETTQVSMLVPRKE